MRLEHRRFKIYWAVGLAFSLLSFILIRSGWEGNQQFHTLIESLCIVLAFFIGLLALIRYYSRSDVEYLILGSGFIGLGVLDSYHTIITSIWVSSTFSSEYENIVHWSWLASRLFLSFILLSQYLVLKWKSENKNLDSITPKNVYTFITLTSLISFIVIAIIPLPDDSIETLLISRPVELIPALIFVFTLAGIIKLGHWRNNSVVHWIVIAIIIDLVSQIFVIPYSEHLFDIQFDLSHLYKVMSYLCILFGLSMSVYLTFKENESQERIRLKAQRALEASEVRNRTMMNSLVDGLILINDKGTIENINTATSELFMYSKLEVLGKNIKMLMPNPYHDNHDQYLANYAETNVRKIIGFSRKVTGLKKDGSTFPMELSVSEMKIAGKVKFCGIIRDDTERLKNETDLINAKNAAQSADLAKSNFLASMSHEIRTPMNGVLGMVELLQDTPLNDQQKDIIKTISDSGNSLIDIINDILEYSKVEADKIDLEFITFNLERTIYDVSRLLLVKAEEKGLELIFYYHADCPDYVIGDAGRIRQILLNLVGNAIKFTDTGQVVIEVRQLDTHGNKSLICISVEDTGIGFDQEVKAQLFESFSQADNSTSRKYGGTGLGLTISKRLVNLMDSDLDVISEPGKGSKFWFNINFENVDSPNKLNTIELNNIRVLIVDDNPVNLKILNEQLTILKMKVDKTSNPQEVVQLMLKANQADDPYQLVIIDSLMPNLNGSDLGRKIKELEKLKSTPLVLLSSAANHGDASIYKEIGFSAYLTKPILKDLLYKTLIRVLGLDEDEERFLTQHSVLEDELEASKTTTRLNGKILLVEDILVNQKVALGQLSKFDLEIDIANNGKEALNLFSNNHYDLILMDCQMPVMDGFEATEEIRKINKTIPVIAVTANALSSDKEKCKAAGMSDYLAKPFNRQQLVNILSRWLNNAEPEMQNTLEQPQQESNTEILDYNALKQMKEAIGSVFEQLIPAYIEQSDKMIQNLEELLKTNDIETLTRYAHSMKSSSKNVGAEIISKSASILEKMCHENTDTKQLQIQIKEVIQDYEAAKSSLLIYHNSGE